MPDFHPLTRMAGLARLVEFSDAGERYGTRRNTDRGIKQAPSTSALFPYLRRRLSSADRRTPSA